MDEWLYNAVNGRVNWRPVKIICGVLAYGLLEMQEPPRLFRHFAARGYPSGRYGSQAYHRTESGLNASAVLAEISRLTTR